MANEIGKDTVAAIVSLIFVFWLYVAAEGQVLDQRIVCAYPPSLIVFLESQMQKID